MTSENPPDSCAGCVTVKYSEDEKRELYDIESSVDRFRSSRAFHNALKELLKSE